MMERLTKQYWRNLDPWECCGQDHFCTRGCHDLGGCTGGCIVPKLYASLGKYEDTGLEHERARELAQAEKEERLLVLPVKPDEIVYQWKKGDDIPSLFRLDGVNINEDGEITYQTHWGETLTPDDFGKTVFLTREEAEAAMKKREADNEAVR